MSLKAFISYASRDRVLAEWVSDTLRERNYGTWIDFAGIQSGEKWESKIKQAVVDTHVTVVVITPDSAKSEWVKREIELSRDLSHPVYALMMYPMDMPETLKTLGIDDLQAIDCFRFGAKSGMQKLCQSLADFQKLSPETRFRALIIEDTASHQTSISQVLQNLGIHVSTAMTSDDALRQIQDMNLHFDLFTLDMQLEQMDARGQHGRNLLFQIRMHRNRTPVVIISSLEFTVDEVRNFILDENADIIAKPFNPRELHKRIVAALKME